MQDRVRLLGIAVDIASTNAASDAAIGFIEEESCRVAYFVNSETLIILENNEENDNVLEDCDMILPGTASVNSSIDQVLGYKRDPFFLESFFDRIFDYSVENGCELQLIAGSEAQYTSVQDSIHEKWSYLTLSGTYLIAPDVLILALNENMQLELLKNYKSQMNAGLILFTGNVLYNKVVSEAKVPESIEKLKIGNIYKWFQKDNSGKNLFNNIKMKLRIKRDK